MYTYLKKYSEQVKDLLVELQKYISSIDIEGYNIYQYRKNINDKNSKVFYIKKINK
jgi:hypothetical protein